MTATSTKVCVLSVALCKKFLATWKTPYTPPSLRVPTISWPLPLESVCATTAMVPLEMK